MKKKSGISQSNEISVSEIVKSTNGSYYSTLNFWDFSASFLKWPEYSSLHLQISAPPIRIVSSY